MHDWRQRALTSAKRGSRNETRGRDNCEQGVRGNSQLASRCQTRIHLTDHPARGFLEKTGDERMHHCRAPCRK